MKFKPCTEEEALNLLPDGEYEFLVKKAEDKVSKNLNDMILLHISIWDKSGKEHFIKDYLMEAIAYKIKHFCEAVGLTAEYEAGEFDARHCENLTGKCKVIIEQQKDTAYPPKNVIKDYIPESKASLEKMTAKAEPFLDDNLPF